MSDHFEFKTWKGIKSNSDRWYKAIELIDVGKNAATFLVMGDTAPHIGVPFAIKVFRRISSSESRSAFLEEASFLKDLDHPGIMRLIDDGVYYDNPFLIAEYYPHTLGDIIQQQQNISIQLKISFAIQLLSALKYLSMHAPPIIHRDLKPANIFVRGITCIIGDFGLKKVLWPDNENDDTNAVKMSEGPGMPLKYRTPELVRYYKNESNVNLTKSDVFQLGLTLAELFTSENPLIPAENYSDPIELNKLSRIDTGKVGAGINGLISSMLRINPAQRPGIDQLLKSWKSVLKDVINNHLYVKQYAFVKENEV